MEITKSLEKTFRIGDPICRYTFADFLLLHEGDMKTIVEKLSGIATMHEAVTATIPIYNHVHNQMNQRSDKLNLQSIKNGRDGLHNILISNICNGHHISISLFIFLFILYDFIQNIVFFLFNLILYIFDL